LKVTKEKAIGTECYTGTMFWTNFPNFPKNATTLIFFQKMMRPSSLPLGRELASKFAPESRLTINRRTGMPKGVLSTQRNFLTNVLNVSALHNCID
jgi:hypothetical protein